MLVCSTLMPKCRPFQVTRSSKPIRPEVTPAMACSPVKSVEAMCRSMLRDKLKTRSTGALIAVLRSILTIWLQRVEPLQHGALLHDQFLDLLHKIRRRHVFGFFFTPSTDVHFIHFGF